MSEHTTEPWDYDREWDTPAVYSEGIHDVIGEGVVNAADARRIVACVNACAGHSTEDLENGTVEMQQLDRIIAKLEQMPASRGASQE